MLLFSETATPGLDPVDQIAMLGEIGRSLADTPCLHLPEVARPEIQFGRWSGHVRTARTFAEPTIMVLWDRGRSEESVAGRLNSVSMSLGELARYIELFGGDQAPRATIRAQICESEDATLNQVPLVQAKHVGWSGVDEKLREFAALGNGWDGADGCAPSDEVIAAARLILVELAADGRLPAPEPIVVGDGEIGFRWNRADRYLSLSFLPDGYLVGYAAGGSWPVWEYDEPITGGDDPVPTVKSYLLDL